MGHLHCALVKVQAGDLDGILGTHNLLADPSARFVDLGPDFYEHRVNKHRRTHSLIRQLQAVGHAQRQCAAG